MPQTAGEAMVTRMSTVSVAEIVDEIRTIAERTFTELDALSAGVEELYARTAQPPTVGDLGRLRSTIIANLGGVRGLVVGSGYIAAPGVLADEPRWMEWWKSEPDSRPYRLVVNLDPAGDDFLDYANQPWFTVPFATRQRHVHGPYVDYLCNDEYTLTFTVPVYRGPEFLGVVGSDIFVAGLETALLPRLRAVGSRAALVNAHGRVVMSNTARRSTGLLVRDPDVATLWSAPGAAVAGLHHCGDFPLALLVEP